MWTGILTVPPVVTDVVTEIVKVGDVASLSDVTVTPAGFVISFKITFAAASEEPCIATI